MQIVWHGTSKENAEKILKEGFKPRSYFAAHLEDALMMGGNYIFEVWFEEKFRRESWQIVIHEAVPPERILRHYKIDKTSIFENEDAQIQVRACLTREEYGPNATLCKTCKGTGERPYKKRKICKDCMGTGCPEQGEIAREMFRELKEEKF